MTWTALVAAALLAASPEFDARSLDGQAAVGRLLALSTEEVVLETSEGRRVFPLTSMAALTRRGADSTEHQKALLWVELIDQSGLPAIEYTVTGATARVQLTSGAIAEIPTQAVRWVRFGAPSERDPKLAQQWSEITDVKAAADLLVVRKSGALDYLEGVLKDIDAATCKFSVDDQIVAAARAKVEGIVYFHSGARQRAEPSASLHASDGTRLSLQSATIAGDVVNATTPGGLTMSWPLEQIVKFDFSKGKIAYLSDLEPENVSYVPYLAFKADVPAIREFFHYRRDNSFEQLPLRLDGKTFSKGLALASRTVLSYRLPDRFRTFRAIAGIDDSVRETGSVHLEIKGDGKLLWEADIRGSDPAQELELEIAGVKRLEIVADYGDDQDIGDRLDLAEARVTK